ncbi:MAG: 16S rRNA (uracil(1498)-N(3))-methyltransferase [Firmicutes bacterium]|nr:16S rRNA (uracil(1498)-N(3))-methyltransferase [Bacillota bacterium]MBQ6810447.1 16S rRNA (uracil(1498)-N(3))-methyltransferase [Bacillota bacterium]
MQTFYIDKRDVDHKRIVVTGDVCHHITRVLRMRVGESLRFSDNEAYFYEGTIAVINKDSVEVAVDDYYSIEDEPCLQVTLIQCLPRGDKMDQILQKATELGVKSVIPAESENSQVRLKNKASEKQGRWQKIVNSAAEQCGRGLIPEVQMPCSLKDAIASVGEDTAILFCYEREENNSFRKTAEMLKAQTKHIALVIGPEGGFSEREADMIIAAGGHSVTMGSRILRTETAGPTALAVLMYEFGEWEAAE